MVNKPSVNLHQLYTPRGIAMVGASNDLEKYNGRTLQYAIDSGYAGGLYPVNPKYQTVLGLPCYASVADIEAPVDVVVALIAAHRLPKLYDDIQQIGASFLVVIGDLVSTEGAEAETTMARFHEAIKNDGPRILGPDCAGYYSPHVPSATGIASALQMGKVPKGHIGVISQSGGVAGVIIDRARHYGTGFSHITATGKAFDIDLLDHLEFMLDDPLTKCISLCYEELDDYPRLFKLAARARQLDKPIILLKTGRTKEAAGAMQSHSGRIIGDWDVQEAAYRRHGIVLAKTIDDMHIAASLLTRFRVDPQTGIGGATSSGGYSVSLADRIVDHGLKVATLAPDTCQRIAQETGQKNAANPVDAGAWHDIANDYTDVVATLCALDDDPGVGATVYSELLFIGMEKMLPELIAFHRNANKPHITCLQATEFPAHFVKTLRDGGGLVVDTPERALQTLDVLYSYARFQQQNPPPLPVERIPSCLLDQHPKGLLNSREARALLAEYGITLLDERSPESFAQAQKHARELTYPLVLKAEVAGVAHKTEAGLVKTDINNDAELDAAMQSMAAVMGKEGRYVVQPQIDDGIEILLGARIDKAVGSVVVLNFGGIFAEAMGKPETELAPLDETTASAMVERLDPNGILSGYRGRTLLDVDALVQLICRFSELIYNNAKRLKEIDLNPVIVCEKDVFIVDVLISID